MLTKIGNRRRPQAKRNFIWAYQGWSSSDEAKLIDFFCATDSKLSVAQRPISGFPKWIATSFPSKHFKVTQRMHSEVATSAR